MELCSQSLLFLPASESPSLHGKRQSKKNDRDNTLMTLECSARPERILSCDSCSLASSLAPRRGLCIKRRAGCNCIQKESGTHWDLHLHIKAHSWVDTPSEAELHILLSMACFACKQSDLLVVDPLDLLVFAQGHSLCFPVSLFTSSIDTLRHWTAIPRIVGARRACPMLARFGGIG